MIRTPVQPRISLGTSDAVDRLARHSNPANLRSRPIYVYAGGGDTVVNYGVCVKADELYSNWKVEGAVEYVQLPNAQHAFATDIRGYGHLCNVLASPFINYCAYDMAGAVLAHIYGPLKPKVDPLDSHVVQVNQTDHVPPGWTAAAASIADTAFAYVPTACKLKPDACKIHVVCVRPSSKLALTIS